MKANAKDLHVLLIDDNPSDRLVAKAFLTALGVGKIDESDNGASALFKLQGGTHDLVITDWKMPMVSGLNFLQRVKSDPLHRNLPVIFMTGVSDEDGVKKAIKEGVTDYLVKPIQAADFAQKLKKIFPQTTFAK